MSASGSRLVFILLLFVVALMGLMFLTLRRAADRGEMLIKWGITLPLIVLIVFSVKWFGAPGVFVIVFCAIILSWLWAPHIGAAIASPLTSAFDGGNIPPEPAPFYSVAEARRKKGQYTEAVAEIRKQLTQFPNDYRGQMLLAEIQAQDLKDVGAAELTIYGLCAQSTHHPRNIGLALYALADWHLALAGDREAARAVLEEIIHRYPNSELSAGAAQRIAHLGESGTRAGPRQPRLFAVKEGIQNLGLKNFAGLDLSKTTDPAEQATQIVQHLEEHPLDTEAREKLAVLYAGHYGRLDMATAELEQLIQASNQPSRSVARWLNLLTDLQIAGGADYETVQATLQRIIDRDPSIAAAELARNRLARVKLELKGNQKNRSVQLGSYEQNIGLKGQLPRRD